MNPTPAEKLAMIADGIKCTREAPAPNVSRNGAKWIRQVRRERVKRLTAQAKEIRAVLADLKARRPIPAAWVEAYTVDLPEGYRHEGDGWRGQWVFHPSTP